MDFIFFSVKRIEIVENIERALPPARHEKGVQNAEDGFAEEDFRLPSRGRREIGRDREKKGVPPEHFCEKSVQRKYFELVQPFGGLPEIRTEFFVAAFFYPGFEPGEHPFGKLRRGFIRKTYAQDPAEDFIILLRRVRIVIAAYYGKYFFGDGPGFSRTGAGFYGDVFIRFERGGLFEAEA
ncbi:MAG: hypothetical protein BWY32_03696 [bacterium ADurb.Bin243]|nr:MAG: hypothetical protein BWY32_03696 [bacterium ADurb.Bin243]